MSDIKKKKKSRKDFFANLTRLFPLTEPKTIVIPFFSWGIIFVDDWDFDDDF